MTNISQEGCGTEELNWKPPYIKIGLMFQDWRVSPRKECGVWGGGTKILQAFGAGDPTVVVEMFLSSCRDPPVYPWLFRTYASEHGEIALPFDTTGCTKVPSPHCV